MSDYTMNNNIYLVFDFSVLITSKVAFLLNSVIFLHICYLSDKQIEFLMSNYASYSNYVFQ
jgi:hypothetical protein